MSWILTLNDLTRNIFVFEKFGICFDFCLKFARSFPVFLSKQIMNEIFSRIFLQGLTHNFTWLDCCHFANCPNQQLISSRISFSFQFDWIWREIIVAKKFDKMLFNATFIIFIDATSRIDNKNKSVILSVRFLWNSCQVSKRVFALEVKADFVSNSTWRKF